MGMPIKVVSQWSHNTNFLALLLKTSYINFVFGTIPSCTTLATLGFVAVQLREMRNMAHHMSVINEENLQDYMYYLYNGRRHEIRNQTATPYANINIQLIKEAIQYIHIDDHKP